MVVVVVTVAVAGVVVDAGMQAESVAVTGWVGMVELENDAETGVEVEMV